MYEEKSMNEIIFVLLFAGIIFWIWQFVDMLTSRMKKKDKGIWTILFLITSILTAFVWLFVRKGRK